MLKSLVSLSFLATVVVYPFVWGNALWWLGSHAAEIVPSAFTGLTGFFGAM